ncbi:MAG TPA: bifunctional glutamate N-acetyltransferase/amino-acid acetyltransferase ArgJ [Frankiaceae bacterium]|nr:bifunctional glutamate N-acetyltransferase/amino-acid acetyltransferase ArgJ [Frankiaceae bacterium]
MSVTAAAGFRAAGVTAGLKASGLPDVALVVNDGPDVAAAGVFTTNRVQAAPVTWSREVLKSGRLRAVILNSGGANACTGARGFGDTHRTAERVAELMSCGAGEVAVASTGLIGEYLPMDKLLFGCDAAAKALSAAGGPDAAEAIRTTDTFAKQAVARSDSGFTVGAMIKGAGMLAPGLATMLCVVTTDAVADASTLNTALREATRRTLDRVDTDGCMSTNDTVLLLASGASGVTASSGDLLAAVQAVLADLCQQLISDAEGASKRVTIDVVNAATEDEAVEVGRSVARSDLLKCALYGNDPNWGRVLAAAGTTQAAFDPLTLDVCINGVMICRDSAPGESRDLVDLSGADVSIRLDLKAGTAEATVLTTDLTVAYVHENSAYST